MDLMKKLWKLVLCGGVDKEEFIALLATRWSVF